MKSSKEIKVAPPEGGTTVSAYRFTWQKLDAAGRATGDMLTDLSLDLAGCGPKGEWAMVEPKPIAITDGRGRKKRRTWGFGVAWRPVMAARARRDCGIELPAYHLHRAAEYLDRRLPGLINISSAASAASLRLEALIQYKCNITDTPPKKKIAT